MAAQVTDMTRGNETRVIIRFALPMLGGNIFQQLYNMVDAMIVGRYVGAGGLAAVGVTGALVFLFFSLCIGLSIGIGVVISYFFGAGDKERVKQTIASSIYIMCAGGLLMSVIGVWLARPILLLLNTPAEIVETAVQYMQIICGGTLFVALYNGISAILRGLGDARTPFIFLIIASILNVALDLLFVIVLDMGVSGAAWATIIAQGFAAAGSFLAAYRSNEYLQLKKEHLRPDRGVMNQCFRIGFPVAAQNALIAISCIALQAVVNRFGETAVAAFTATNRIEQLVQQPYNTICAALATFTGQNLGAGKRKRVRTGFRRCMQITAIFSAVMLVVAWAGGGIMMRLFVREEAVISMGVLALRITCWFYFPLGVIYVTRGLLNGASDGAFAMISGGVEVAGRVGLAAVILLIPVVGVYGVWWASGITWTITAIAGYARYRSGRWKRAAAG